MNETQSKIIKNKVLKYKKSVIIIMMMRVIKTTMMIKCKIGMHM
jgi:hypothetical protein